MIIIMVIIIVIIIVINNESRWDCWMLKEKAGD